MICNWALATCITLLPIASLLRLIYCPKLPANIPSPSNGELIFPGNLIIQDFLQNRSDSKY
jgi:hypothetical protein